MWGGRRRVVQGKARSQCLESFLENVKVTLESSLRTRTLLCLPLQASVEIPGLQLSNQDYFPYVYFHIDLSLLD